MARWPVAVGAALALIPFACTGGDASIDGVDLPDTTPFRTVLVPIETTTTTIATTVPPSTPPIQTLPSTVAGDSTGAGTYTVVSGDAWWFIAQKLGIDLQALLTANAATVQTFLFPGQVLRLPAGSAGTVPPVDSSAPTPGTTSAPSGATYTVQPGDAWYLIARVNGVDVQALLAVNGATLKTPLYPGQVLDLPG